jgi:CRP-like cAMP-binding protein
MTTIALTDDIALLASTPLFGLLDREPLRLLAFAAEIRMLNAGDVLFRKGDRSDGGYVVTDGAIVLDRGNGVPPFVAERGALIGRTSLLVRTVRSATAAARERSTVMRISPTLMRRVLEEFPSAANALYDSFSDEVATLSAGLERVREKLLAI